MLASVLFLSTLLVGLVLSGWRALDRRADRRAMDRLLATQPSGSRRFDPAMVAALPEPARRYFLYTIPTGAPLCTVARITMTGRFGMGTRDKPNYMDMVATQILALPDGFVWQMCARRGWMRLSGSDSESWTRFWLMGVLPVARMGGDPDHACAAFGRYVAEAVFWTPAAVLPGPGIHWEQVDTNCARVAVSHRGFTQAVDVTVAPDGRPTQVRFERWSNANAEKEYRLQPFGGDLSVFREFSGFRLPTHVEAGNAFGTEQYFPFFVADVGEIEFPHD